ncbi:protein kinase [Melanogaster broomeanus]|nr:protein kinase [Melanogaster broomeanus]
MAFPQLVSAFDSLKDQAKDAIWALSSCLCQQSARVKINGRTFNIIKVLGEGGFSFVYLAQDETSGRQFALKKIRCPTGSEGVKEAMREVEAYRRFKHPNIIRILDSAVVQDPEGEGQIVYLFLPLIQGFGSHRAIHSLSNAYHQAWKCPRRHQRQCRQRKHFSEKDMARIFKGTCEAVRAMHDYHTTTGSQAHPQTSSSHMPAPSMSRGQPSNSHNSDDDEGDELLPHPEGDGEGGYSYKSSVNVPLMTKRRVGEGDVVFDGDEEVSKNQPLENGNAEPGKSEPVPYAHRDIKPGAMKARIRVETRSQALLQQDIAAEQSTMTYRAPELFDVKTGVTIDEMVDIWSLGCTLFAMAYSHSPFENTQTTEQGGSIAMAVLNAQYKHPSSGYSQGLKDLIDSMLKVNPKDRPNIHEVIQATDRVLQSLT